MSQVRTSVLDDLRAACDGHAEEAGAGDVVDGVPAACVARPASTEQTAAVMRAAAAQGLRVVVRGQGTALNWGAPPTRLDLLVDTGRMDQVVEHVAGDLVCVVQAGARLDDVAAVVGRHGQQLALDQPRPGASVGGTLATSRSGPRRVQYGTPRDLVLGVTIVRADGVVASAGGKVVKNVAGYDLSKLVTGSYGTLGVVTQAVFRLHPLPAVSRWLARTCADGAAAVATALAVTGSQVAPSEISRAPGAGPVGVAVLLEGTVRGVAERSSALRDLLGGPGSDDVTPPRGVGTLPAGPDSLLLKVTARRSDLSRVLAAVAATELRHDVPLRTTGSAGAGVLHVGAPGDADPLAVAAVVADLRAATPDGAVVVLQAPAAVRAVVDGWGPVGGLDLMRAVKDRFDPERRLAPGRFVGGI
jgi:glycolate oxidase FAD binding subunit